MATSPRFVDAAIPRMVAKRRHFPLRAARHRACSGPEPTMSRAPRLILTAALVAGLPALASADPVLEGSVIEIEVQVPLEDSEGEFVVPTDDIEREQRFNLARCYCGSAGVNDERTQFAVELRLEPSTSASIEEPVDVWPGVDCLVPDLDQRTAQCGDAPVHEFEDADDLSTEQTLIFTVDQAIDPSGMGDCEGVEQSSNAFAAPDFNDTSIYDDSEKFSDEDGGIPVDTLAPSVPDRFTAASGGEGAIFLDWDALDDTDEIWRWQALCAK